MKKILITGANSYIGTSFENYIKEQFPDRYTVDTVDMIDESWRKKDFSGYDTVFHVAGIAHSDNGKISEEQKKLYYQVNTELTIETAEKAKRDGVKQFIFMSSAIVYGDSAPIGKTKRISKDTPLSPANAYGDSKAQAEKGILPLSDERFKVVVLRPPMIYGSGSKGNYPQLSKFAQKLPIFPDVQNERSMLYIENLTEFIRLMIENEESGIFFPQNAQYSSTSHMVKEIADAHGKRIKLVKGFTWMLKIMSHFTGLVNKAFGNLSYDMSLSGYKENYRRYSLTESIRLTETAPTKKKVLILVNHNVVIYNFRKELVQRLVAEGYEVYLSCPQGNRIAELQAMGCRFIETNVDRRSKNPFADLKLIRHYKRMMKEVRPDIVLSYTIKPNIYGGIAARKLGIPQLANITGLGTAVENPGLAQKLIILLYRLAFKKTKKIYLQNEENLEFFRSHHINNKAQEILPGSGVNLKEYQVSEYPDDSTVKFLFLSRILKEKGIDYYLGSATAIKAKYTNVEFHICGFSEDEYTGKLDELNQNGTVIYHGMIHNVRDFLKDIHCVIHPTYYPEGISNVLLESCASGRPIITTDRSGCREVVDNGINGYMVRCQNQEDLNEAIERFLQLSYEQKKTMGLKARAKVEKEFDRQIVVNRYIEEIEKEVY